jgi:hypothetical protein
MAAVATMTNLSGRCEKTRVRISPATRTGRGKSSLRSLHRPEEHNHNSDFCHEDQSTYDSYHDYFFGVAYLFFGVGD